MILHFYEIVFILFTVYIHTAHINDEKKSMNSHENENEDP